jgi:hypothetical protein
MERADTCCTLNFLPPETQAAPSSMMPTHKWQIGSSVCLPAQEGHSLAE